MRWDERPTFALDADVTVYWPDVRPCWEPSQTSIGVDTPPEERASNDPAHMEAPDV